MFSKLPLNILLREHSRLAFQHLHLLCMGHPDLLSNWHQTFRQVVIVVPHQPICDHQVVDVAEYECVLSCVDVFSFEKGCGMIAPVPKWIQVMRGVVAVIETVAVALRKQLPMSI